MGYRYDDFIRLQNWADRLWEIVRESNSIRELGQALVALGQEMLAVAAEGEESEAAHVNGAVVSKSVALPGGDVLSAIVVPAEGKAAHVPEA